MPFTIETNGRWFSGVTPEDRLAFWTSSNHRAPSSQRTARSLLCFAWDGNFMKEAV